MADPIPTTPPTIEEQIAAAELALHQVMLSGGVTSYAIGGRQVTKNLDGLRAYLAELRRLQGGVGGGGRNYVSFGRRT